jgi:protein required for attachment to host cells
MLPEGVMILDKDGNQLKFINNAAAKIIFNKDLCEVAKSKDDINKEGDLLNIQNSSPDLIINHQIIMNKLYKETKDIVIKEITIDNETGKKQKTEVNMLEFIKNI